MNIKGLLSIGFSDILGTGISAIFWFFMATLMEPEKFGEIFKLKNIEVLMRLASDSVITTDTIEGISYKKLLLKIEKNKQ